MSKYICSRPHFERIKLLLQDDAVGDRLVVELSLKSIPQFLSSFHMRKLSKYFIRKAKLDGSESILFQFF